MGQACSSYKSKRREKADRRRRLREQVEEATECIVRLQQQQQLLNEKLQKLYMYYPALRPQHKDGIECKTPELKEEVHVLERKLFLEKIALSVTDDRCDFLDTNLRLLQQNEVALERESSNAQRNLAALKLKHEACQFNLYQKANPTENWTVCSLPNLYFPSFQLSLAG